MGAKKEAKTDSEQLQNVSQDLLFPLVETQNGLKQPKMAPKGPLSLPSVNWGHILCHCTIFGIIGDQKRGQKQTQDSSRMFLRVYFFILSCLCPKWAQMAPKVYHQYTRVVSFVNAQDWDHWGLFGYNEFKILECFYLINTSKWSSNMKS